MFKSLLSLSNTNNYKQNIIVVSFIVFIIAIVVMLFFEQLIGLLGENSGVL